MTPITIASLVGSLRAESFNRAVARTAAELAPKGVTFLDVSLADVPLYNGDVEDAGDPPAVTALKTAVSGTDGLILFTPEYNRSIPAVTKNAVDWLSRPVLEGPIAALPVGIVAASPGRHGAGGVRAHLEVAAAGAGGAVHDPSLGLGSIARAVQDGRIADDEMRGALGEWLEGFVAAVRSAVEVRESA